MKHAVNLLRFAGLWAVLVFAFAFNAAAMYAQVVYVFLPATRVTGGAPAQWGYQPSKSPLTFLATTPGLFLGLCLAVIAIAALVIRRSPR